MYDIKKYDRVDGVSLMLIRKLNRIGLETFIKRENIKEIFHLKTNFQVNRIIECLEKNGYIAKYNELELWFNTISGNILANTKFIRPIKRVKCESIIRQLLSRAKKVNENTNYLLYVDSLLVTGDFLDESLDTIHHLLVGVELKRKYSEGDHNKLRAEKIRKSKKAFPTIIDELSYPNDEVKNFLKSRTHNLIILNKYDAESLEYDSKIIYKKENQ